MALAYTLVGILLGAGLLLCAGVAVGLWLGVKSMRPELMDQAPPDEGIGPH